MEGQEHQYTDLRTKENTDIYINGLNESLSMSNKKINAARLEEMPCFMAFKESLMHQRYRGKTWENNNNNNNYALFH